MKRRLLTPVIENITDAAIICSRGVFRVGAPARMATSASPVASMTRLARIASRPDLLSVITPRITPSLTIGATNRRCSIGATLRLLDQDIGDVLEHLRVERVADRLRLRHCRAHRLGSLFELDADSFAVDGTRVAVPGEAFHTDLSDIAAKAAVSLE